MSQTEHKDLDIRFHFTIGANDMAGLDQFPTLGNLPSFGPAFDDYLVGYELGFALGLGYLKLRRPWPVAHGEKMELDQATEYLARLLADLSSGKGSQAIREGFLAVPDGLVDLTLNRPDLVPDLIAQVDALTNEDLRALCIAALNSTRQVSMFFLNLDGAHDIE